MNADCEECVGCNTINHISSKGNYRKYSCDYKHNDDSEPTGHLCEDFEIAKNIIVYEINDDED